MNEVGEVCFCGEWMLSHPSPMECGHMPVSMGLPFEEERNHTVHPSLTIFLVNKTVRAVAAAYDPENSPSKRDVFKTLDDSIKVGDFVLIPTEQRCKMSVFKVMELDPELDFDRQGEVKWIIGRVDKSAFDRIVEQERTIIETAKRAEFRARQQALADKMLASNKADLAGLALVDTIALPAPPAAPRGDPEPPTKRSPLDGGPF